ncbi:hypothetical protein PR048_009654 [Dryococelus australis]|uniref:Integrase zinc-binding domain-containing protein n=1 Tax=Dryococelus australis TaxID=614101 RepID=A0ABQ9I0H0_9NEOP|nr:hypothetical protein PR048_009654 [Dryococelus australis]
MRVGIELPQKRNQVLLKRNLQHVFGVWEYFLSTFEYDELNLMSNNQALSWIFSHPQQTGKIGSWITRLARLRFNIIHVTVKESVITDCLPRIYYPEYYEVEGQEGIHGEEQEFCNAIKSIAKAFIGIADWQEQVEDCQYIIKEISRGIGNTCGISKGVLYYIKKVVAPENGRGILMKYFYDYAIVGQMGVMKTKTLIKRKIYWLTMNHDIVQYIRKSLRSNPTVVKLAYIILSCPPDHPDKETTVFSQWLMVSDMKANTPGDKVGKVFGRPMILVSDSECYFNSKCVKNHVNTSDYNYSNLVKRVNKNVKVALAINPQTIEVGMSQYPILLRVPRQQTFSWAESCRLLLLNTWCIPSDVKDTTNQKKLEDVWEQAYRNLNKDKQAITKMYVNGRLPNHYDVGQWVLCRQVGLSKKRINIMCERPTFPKLSNFHN